MDLYSRFAEGYGQVVHQWPLMWILIVAMLCLAWIASDLIARSRPHCCKCDAPDEKDD